MARQSNKKRLEKRFSKTKPAQKVGYGAESLAAPASGKNWYDKSYKALLLIPFVLLVAAFVVIGMHYAQTGDYFNKGISLSGGTAVTITPDMADIFAIDPPVLTQQLQERFSGSDIIVRTQNQLSQRVAVEVETDITDQAQLETFKIALSELVEGLTVEEISSSSSTSGSALGDAFVSQIIKAMIFAFILMGIVVFIQFKVPIPSLAVILAALSDIIITLAVVNLLGIKISSAGIAAFLMLIGYSVDTDIMLSTRVLKTGTGSVNNRIKNSFKTGMTMSITTLAAVTVGMFVSQSAVISQIMLIIFIGLIVDMISTWLQNAGILKWYVERKGGFKDDE